LLLYPRKRSNGTSKTKGDRPLFGARRHRLICKTMPKISERNGELGLKLVANMERMTSDRHGRMALDNAERNLPHIREGKSIRELRDEGIGSSDHTIMIAAGPSVKRRDPLREIKEASYGGPLIVSESALAYCLRNGVVPDLAVTLDPHATRVVRWLGDPTLTEEKLRADDYFSRQDQDDAFANEMRANEGILSLLDEHGKDIRMAMSTSASKAVVDRAMDVGMQCYWWNPMFDDPDDPDSITADLQRRNGLPSLNAGGNVGTASWMMASAVLEFEHIALTGVDFSYYDDTPYFNTQYYHEAVDLVGEENLDAIFMRIHNPHLDAWFYTDPAYMWYKQCFLEMVLDTNSKTFNCTEGGILFGDGIEVCPLAEFLARFGSAN